MKVLECSRHFPHCRSIGIFFKHSRAANSAVHVRIRLNFKIIRDFIVVLVTCKNEEDPIKNEGAVVFTPFYIDLSDSQWQITPESDVGSGRNLHSFKLSCKSLLPVRMEMIQ